MNLERYKYAANESLQTYEFVSQGPNGKIRKIIRYSPQNVDGVTYFNIAFGDIIPRSRYLNDLSISDNKDTEKILATIAATVLEFTEHFPDMMVYAKGSTPARTRLYQMGISAHWNEIVLALNVFGFINNKWEPFEKRVNYEAFLAIRKKS